MADPLEVLRRPIVPLDPDPTFASRLRSRLARELNGDPMTATLTEPAAAPSLVPYLAVHDARAALEWYADALGARVVGEPIVMPDGRVGHAELALSGAMIYLSDDHPEIDVVGPVGRGGTTVTLHLSVASSDDAVDAAVRQGATLERPPADSPYGRTGVIRDPFGHRWMLQSPVAAPSEPSAAMGDLAFFSLHLPSADLAREFYGAVLGWKFGDSGADGHIDQITNLSLPAAVWDGFALPGIPRPGIHVIRRVDDIHAAVAKIRSLGGTADEPEHEVYGVRARCLDNQGNGFSVIEMPVDAPRPSENGARNGDVSYLTVAVNDEPRAAEFYGPLFGWQFSPGTVDRGLQLSGPRPMTGFWGGTGRQNITLMYRVDDIDSAVAAVRANGGTATDPEQEPYGRSSECTDNQGMAFYLGQH